MPRIQIDSDAHLEFLELYRQWADELPQSDQKRARTLVEGEWETLGERVEIKFKVDDSFLAFLGKRRFRYRKI